MGLFGQIANNLEKINLNKIYQDVFSEANIQKWIIETIQKRLYGTGVDGKGSKLKTDKSIEEGLGNRYAHSTINESKPPGRFQGKKQKGLPYDHVTLYNESNFYDSMKVLLNLFGFETDANFQKKNGHMYRNFTRTYSSKAKYTSDVMSLTDKELNNLLINKAIPLIGNKIVEQML